MNKISKKEKKTENAETTSSTDVKSLKKMYPRAWLMTSADFHDDPDSRLTFMMSRVKDKTTLNIFRKAIVYNRHLFVGKKVLILNCGVDILLTLWAIKNDPAHIYGIDTSNAIEYLKNVICTNDMGKNVTLIRGHVQNIKLPVNEVDIIICNWMGYSLFFDSKWEDVIYARDKWLKKDTGIIFPDYAMLYVVGMGNPKSKNQHVDWWRDVNGFNMKAIRKFALSEPAIQTVDENELITDPVNVWNVNMYKITKNELQFHKPFSFITKKCGTMEGMLTFFDVHFLKSHTPMGFSTAPMYHHTNWLQTVFYFDEPQNVNRGERFYCGMQISPRVDAFKGNIYRVIIETFSGAPPNLSQLSHMTWARKAQSSLISPKLKTNIILKNDPEKAENTKKAENTEKAENTVKAENTEKADTLLKIKKAKTLGEIKNTNISNAIPRIANKDIMKTLQESAKKSNNANINTKNLENRQNELGRTNLTVNKTEVSLHITVSQTCEKKTKVFRNFFSNDGARKKEVVPKTNSTKESETPVSEGKLLSKIPNKAVRNNEILPEIKAPNQNNVQQPPKGKQKFGDKKKRINKHFSAALFFD